MSNLAQIKISGIRSFDDKVAQTIKFETPLTLIVGQNGCGKTTIIECLKYAFTGLQPPNTKVGGAFVHDPKLSSVIQVKAAVAASFRAANGSALTVTRRLELNVKKASRSLKSLESSLVVKRRGETTVLSTRVAELDEDLPKYLGVSTAIIDNVIFCHQDESFWPLSDASTLKKKFDEIFEAQKYTKAILNIKEIQKSRKNELDKLLNDESYARKDKDRAAQTQKQMDKLSEEIETLRLKNDGLNQRISQAKKMADETWRKGEEYAVILGTLEGKRIEAASKQSIIDDIEVHLEEVDETDEWLQNTLEQFDARQQELQDEVRQKKGKYLEEEDQMKSLGKQREEKVRLKGNYEGEKESHERSVTRRKHMARDVAAKHQIREYEYLDDDNLVEEFLVKIRNVFKQRQEALNLAKQDHTTQRRNAQAQVTKLTERKTALRDQRAAARKQMESNDREATTFQQRVNQITVDEGSKAVAETRIEDLDKELDRARKAAEEAGWDKRLESTNGELRGFEEARSRLDAEVMQATKKATELAKLSHLKQEVKERRKRLETLLAAHSDRITALFGKERVWGPDTVEGVYQQLSKDAGDETLAAEQKRDGVNREVEQLQFKLNTVRKDLSRKKAEADKSDKQIRAVIEGGAEGFDKALEQAEEFVGMARENSSGWNGLLVYYQKVLTKATQADKPHCKTCNRGFKKNEDLAKFQQLIQDQISAAEQSAKQVDPAAAEAEYKRVLDLSVVRDTWKKLSGTEIPAAEKDLGDLGAQRESLLKKLEAHDKTVLQNQQAKRDLESISQTVASIGRCDGEVKAFSDQVEELATKKSQQSIGRTLDEIQEELETAVQNIRDAQSAINRIRSEQDQSRSGISSMELELRDLAGNLNNIKFQLEKKMSLAARVDEFRTMNEKQKELMESIGHEIERLDPEISSAQAKYDDIDHRATETEREISDDLSKIGDSINNLDILNGQIQSYIDREGPNQLARVNRDLKNLEQELESLQTEHRKLTSDINKISDRIKDGETLRRRYSDNLRHRQETRAVSRLLEEIADLETHNAEADRARFQQDSAKYTQELNRATTLQAGVMGEVKAKDNQLAGILLQYQQELKDAPQRYKTAHIKAETTKAVVDDLGRYGGALDKAIMKYHGLKMDEINTIIEELWRKTYRGTDVDTIMIKAENEEARSNRSYNYRVVMVKRGAEMDMRGRCSAGQKVLASIIIRLALAECFSASCGLIALDEPTTNLDRDNIESLAQSLKEIIEYRQQQKNFQLVVVSCPVLQELYRQNQSACDKAAPSVLSLLPPPGCPGTGSNVFLDHS